MPSLNDDMDSEMDVEDVEVILEGEEEDEEEEEEQGGDITYKLLSTACLLSED